MRLISTFLLCFCFFATIFRAEAQDPRFAQFYAAPLQVNPALIGVYQGQYRAVINYRELYTSILSNNPFRTIGASFDMRYRVMQGDYIGVGISAMRDQAGVSAFNRFRGNLGASFLKQLGGGRYGGHDQYLVAGAQIGVGQRGLDWGKMWFSQQYNEDFAFVDPTVDNGEGLQNMNTDIYLDFNAGLLWYALFADNQSLYFGGAIQHLNTPNISFLENVDEKLHMKFVGQVGGELPFNDNLSILPAALVMSQNKYMSITAGGNFRYTNRDWREVAIRAGVWAHVANELESGMGLDAVVIAAILETERWNIGVSYDVTASSLAEANNSRGAFELSLIYVHPEKQRRPSVNCPKF